MPGKRKIMIDTLTELGAHKLAELLIAEAAGSRKLKQAIDLAMSSKEGPVALGAAVQKRLAGFAKSRSMPSYERGREIIVEFDGLRTMIVENIGVENPRLAIDLLWELIELHPSILELVDDSSGYAGDVPVLVVPKRLASTDGRPILCLRNENPPKRSGDIITEENHGGNTHGFDNGL